MIRRLLSQTGRSLLLRHGPPDLTLALAQWLRRDGRAFPRKRVLVTDILAAEKVLVLAPHPDDEVIGLGGTIARYLDGGNPVTVAYMTDGAGAGRSDLAAVRRGEAEAVGREFSFRQVFLDYPDTELTNNAATVARLRDVLSDVQPDVIYVPSFFEHHFDHFTTSQVLCDALSALSELDAAVAGYEVWEILPFPNRVHDVTASYPAKIRMMSHYATPQHVTDFVKLFRYRNAVQYVLHVDSRRRQEEGYAEAFFRFPAETYCALHAGFRNVLEEVRSALPSHLVR